MRPLSIRLAGFTSFREEQELRFDQLDLFAICGQTGSGKSSLLDAMTYALFGWIERVGKQVSQLISQGQNRMRVLLEFAVGDERYRVTRSTPATGATKASLERWTGDEWVSAGEGADRVTEVNKRIVALVGLDYDAFTRSVLLPQGKFAEFLVGESAKRREILSDLLGLSLFKAMSQRANEIQKDARTRAENSAEGLERDYEGVTEEALAAARAAAAEAEARETSLDAIATRLQSAAERWSAARLVAESLESCARDARAVAGAFEKGAASIERMADAARALKEAADAAEAAVATADAALAAAAKARADAEARWGSTALLVELKVRAEALGALAAEARAAEQAVELARARTPAMAGALSAATDALQAAQAALARADEDLARAREEYKELERSEYLAVACEGLHAGDECPVCASTLTADPPRPTRALQQAADAGRKLAEERQALDQRVQAAARARDTAARDVEEAAKDLARAEAELVRRTEALAAARRELAPAFADEMPAEPAVEIARRLSSLQELIAKESAASDAAQRAAAVARDKRDEAQEALRGIETERARLEAQPVAATLQRAREASGGSIDLAVPALAATDAPANLAASARELAQSMLGLAGALDARAEKQRGGEQALVAEARETVGDLVEAAGSFEDIVRAVSRAQREATGSRAAALKEAETIERRLKMRAELKAEIDALGLRADRFRLLAKELQANNLVAFLQSEALQVLCVAGTDHLLRLSDGRYRLVCEDDEFHVVDTWNGEEQRSVKTLSGGETFMASLALALALSEQQPSLSVERRARVDSLFLDEGFGTLDPHSLEEVVQALEQLGGDGRLVGVVTHIAELADRMPSKVVVEKSPRGSRITVSSD